MYKDLAQISKAKDIYRTLDLLAILSHKGAGHETVKCEPGRNNYKTDEQVDISDAGITKKSIGHQPDRRDSDVG
jgi:hypothetical protein